MTGTVSRVGIALIPTTFKLEKLIGKDHFGGIDQRERVICEAVQIKCLLGI